MASKNPNVIAAAGRGEQWAIKLSAPGGWKTLSKAQKATARANGVGVRPQTAIIPTTVRLVNGNPTGKRRRGDGTPGNALKSMTISKGEFLGELYADNQIKSFIIDPRNIGSFPTLSTLALSYNKYRLVDFKVRYSPKVQDSECGITIAYSSDASDPKPNGKFDLYSLSSKFESAAHKGMLVSLPVPKAVKYARDCPTESSKDVDSGVVYVMIDGEHDGRLGELFFEFTIVLSEPTFNQRMSQLVIGHSTRSGPSFADIARTSDTVTFTFKAAGNFLLSSFSSKLIKVGQLGMKQAEQKQTDSEEYSSNIIEVVADKPGSSVTMYYADPKSTTLRAYITRL